MSASNLALSRTGTAAASLPQAFADVVARARSLAPMRVAVANAAQPVVIETVREAVSIGLVEPTLIGRPHDIEALCRESGWQPAPDAIVPAESEAGAAAAAVHLVHEGAADVVMKGRIHTDAFMRALLDPAGGLRLADRRVSHLFLAHVPTYPKCLGVTDAAINIAPDLRAKAQILQNAVDFFAQIGVERPKAAVLSAVETVNPDIPSTLDAACLAVMALRGQIRGAEVEGPLAFDNAISRIAAKEKGIASDVAGDVDLLLVPDLVSGNVLVKNLEYLAGAVAAGLVLGLHVPVVLTSRSDPPAARLVSLALARLACAESAGLARGMDEPQDPRAPVAAQPEAACCPLHTLSGATCHDADLHAASASQRAAGRRRE